MSEDNEFSVFISSEQKRVLIMSIFWAYYYPQAEKEAIFDTNRLWCSKLPLIQELFPEAKVICCVRNIAWIMDSIELLIRRNAFDVSRLFNHPAERTTVYSRTEALSQGSRLVGYGYNALKEAFYSEQSASLFTSILTIATLEVKGKYFFLSLHHAQQFCEGVIEGGQEQIYDSAAVLDRNFDW